MKMTDRQIEVGCVSSNEERWMVYMLLGGRVEEVGGEREGERERGEKRREKREPEGESDNVGGDQSLEKL